MFLSFICLNHHLFLICLCKYIWMYYNYLCGIVLTNEGVGRPRLSRLPKNSCKGRGEKHVCLLSRNSNEGYFFPYKTILLYNFFGARPEPPRMRPVVEWRPQARRRPRASEAWPGCGTRTPWRSTQTKRGSGENHTYANVCCYSFICFMNGRSPFICLLKREEGERHCGAGYVCVRCRPIFLDVSFVDVPVGVAQDKGHTGFLQLPPAVLALLLFEKDSVVPFPRRP